MAGVAQPHLQSRDLTSDDAPKNIALLLISRNRQVREPFLEFQGSNLAHAFCIDQRRRHDAVGLVRGGRLCGLRCAFASAPKDGCRTGMAQLLLRRCAP